MTASPGGAMVTTDGAATNVTFNGLADGTVYTFEVAAANAVGAGPASARSAPITPAHVPDAPTTVTAVAGNGAVAVTWAAPYDGGSPITGYTVSLLPGDAQVLVGPQATSAVVDELTNGTTYTVSVVAANAIGDSVPATVSSVTPLGVPTPPTNVSADAAGAQATVSWQPPVSDGDDAVSGYTVTASPGGQTMSVGSSALSATFTGLYDEVTYTFTIVANNSLGQSLSATANATPLGGQPPSASSTVAVGPGVVSTFAGSGASGQSAAGSGSAAVFYAPLSVVVVGGFAYVADYDAIMRVDLSSGVSSVFVGQPGARGCVAGTSGAASRVDGPQSLVSDGYYLYFRAPYCGPDYVWRVSLATGAASPVGSSAAINGLAVGPGGLLYATSGASVLRLDPATGGFAVFAALPSTGYAVTADAQYLWVAVSGAIERVSAADGSVSQLVTDGLLSVSVLSSAGDYLYGVSGNDIVRRWSKADGSFVDVAGSGARGYVDGDGTDAWFYSPTGIASDGTNLWVTDDNRLRVIQVVKGPVAAGGPTNPGETWGCGPVSENATMPACTDFVDPGTGAGVTSETDFAISGRGPGLMWARSYDSQATAADGPLGHGWAGTYSMAVIPDPYYGSGSIASSPVVDVVEESGSRIPFVRNADGSYSASSRVLATLTQNSDGTWKFVRRKTEIFTFDSLGRESAEEDLNGNATTLSYDASGRLATVTDSAERALTFTYGSNGKIATVTDPMGRVVSYGYDAADDLTSVTEPMGRVTTYAYDALHNMTAVTRPLGGHSTSVYDSDRRIVSHTDALGHTTTFAYSAPTAPGSFTETRTDPMGVKTIDVYNDGELMSSTAAAGTSLAVTTTYAYDAATNGLIKVTDPLGHVTTATYDSHGNKLTSTDADGRTTRWTYNGLDEVLTTTDPMGVTTTNMYDGRGNLLTTSTPIDANTVATSSQTYGDPAHLGDVTASTDPDGRTTRYTYDAYGNKVGVTDPAGDETTYGYDLDGEQTSAVAPDGNAAGASPADYTTLTAYDADGEVTAVTDPLEDTTSYGYDLDGNKTTVTDATGLTTTSVYGVADELVSVTRPDETKTVYGYDDDLRRTSEADAAGNTTSYGYDPRGREVSVTDPTGAVTTSTYDLAGRLLSVRRPDGGVTSYTYDAAGQRLTTTDPTGGTSETAYDGDGRVASVTDPDGNTTHYAYDGLGRETVTTQADGTVVADAYDPAGQLLQYTDAAGDVTTYAYGPAGRRTSSTDPDGRTTRYAYDASGNPVSLTDAMGRVTSRTFDEAGRLTATAYSDGSTPSVGYTYDDAGRRLTMSDGTGLTTYSYDEAGRLIQTASAVGGDVGFAYDDLGRLRTLTYPDGNAITQTYDAAGRVASVTDWAGRTTSFGYDGDGNLVATTYPNGVVDTTSVDLADRVTGVNVASGVEALASFAYTYDPAGLVSETTDSLDPNSGGAYSYDARNRLTQVGGEASPYSYDAAGDLTGLADGTTMTYDPAGQLATSRDAGGAVTSYAFDGVGERVAQESAQTTRYAYDQAERLASVTNPTGTTDYSYNGDGLRVSDGRQTFTWDDAGSLPVLLSDGANDYIYGPNGDVIEQANRATGQPSYLHADRLGSTRLITSSDGAVTRTQSYDAYGNLTSATGAAASPFGYTGQYTDPDGLLYLRARYYDPATAQFLTVDPLIDATRAAYSYANANPINNTDPDGLMFVADMGEGSTPAEAAAITDAYARSGADRPAPTPAPHAPGGPREASEAGNGPDQLPQAAPPGRKPVPTQKVLPRWGSHPYVSPQKGGLSE